MSEAASTPAPAAPEAGEAVGDFAALADEMFGSDQPHTEVNPFEQDIPAVSGDAPAAPASSGVEGDEGGAVPAVPSDSPPTPAQPAPTEAVPAQPSPAPTPTPAQPAPAAQPESLEDKLRKASEAAELQRLRAENEALRKTAASKQEPATPAAPQQQEQTAPRHNVQVPEAMLSMLDSDDPQQRASGMNQLVSGVISTVHQLAINEAQKAAKAAVDEYASRQTTATQQTAQQQQLETMRQEFYSDFPQYNSPQYAPIISQVAAQMAAEFPSAPWDANYRAALGQRVGTFLQELGAAPGAPAAVTPTPAPTIPAKPAAMVPAGTRSQTPSGEDPFHVQAAAVLQF